MRLWVQRPGGLAGIVSIAGLALGCAGCGSVAVQASTTSVLRGHFQRQSSRARRAQRARRPVAMGFFNGRRGVIATAGDGTLLTSDGGGSWHRGPQLALRSIDVVSGSVAYATTGHRLLRTDDAGRHWRAVAHVRGTLSFADRLHGWIGGGRRAWTTDDGGRTLQRLHLPCRAGPVGTVVLSRVTATLGLAACAGEPGAGSQQKRLYVTHDAGRTWQRAPGARLPRMGYLNSIVFDSQRVGYMTTDRGGLSVTHNRGHSWRTLLLTDDTTDLAAIQRLGARRLIVLLADGTLLRSLDAGTHWRTLYPRTVPQPATISFSTAAAGIGLGASSSNPLGPMAVLATHDGGRSWRVRSRRRDLQGLERVSSNVLYATAGPPPGPGRSLVRSSDDGRSWHRVNAPVAVEHISSVSFTTSRHGVLVANSGRSYVTDDAGRSWRLVARHGHLSDVGFLTAKRGYAIHAAPAPRPTLKNPKPQGSPSTVEQTLDGGRTWHPYTVPGMRHEPVDLVTLPPSTVWVLECSCGGRHAIDTTSDGGNHWRRIEYRRLPPYGNLDLVAPRVAYLSGDPAYRTTDGGRTWRLVTGPSAG